MIVKVAEAQALRKAFQISGIYSPDEMPDSEKPPMRDITPDDEPKGKFKKAPVHIHAPIVDAEAEQRK
jgi:hypothetical protein